MQMSKCLLQKGGGGRGGGLGGGGGGQGLFETFPKFHLFYVHSLPLSVRMLSFILLIAS